MAELLVFPTAAVLARECLLAGLASLGVSGVPVAGRVPNPRPDRFVRVAVAGGREVNPRQHNMFVTVQVYDSDEMRGLTLCGQLAAVLRNAPEDGVGGEFLVATAEHQSGPYDYPDPDLPSVFRTQAVVGWLVVAPV